MKKRILAAVAACLMLAFSACGASNTTGAALTTTAGTTVAVTDTAATQATSGSDEAPNPFKKYDPPIEMPVAFNTSAVQYFPEGDDYENNVWSRYLKENAGIIIKVLWTADGSTDAYRNKMNVSLASGDLPTVFDGDYQFFRNAVDAGYAADLTDVWEQWRSPALIKQSTGFDVPFASATIDGKLMAIPQLAYLEQQGPILWIRDDWLTAVGKSAPETLDDVIDIARAFKDQDPDGNGVNDTFGLGLRKDIFNFDFFNVNGIMSAYGVPTRKDEQFFRDDSGKIIYAGIMPEAKEPLKLLNQLYSEGLIDPEFGVKDAPKIEEDINTNKVGMAYGAEWNGWYPYASIYAADKVVYKAYAPPAAQDRKLSIGTPFPVQWYNLVNSSYEYPEAVIVMRNWANDLLNEDASDEIIEKYNAKEQWRFVPWKFAAPSEMQMLPYLEDAYANDYDESVVPNSYRRYFKEVMSFINDGDPAGQGRWSQVGPEGSVGIILHDLMPANVFSVSPIVGERPESYLNLMTSLNKIIEQSYTEIIVGPTSDVESKFDSFVSSWLSAGGQQVLDDLNTMYPAQ
ncbi:MAG: extracellular solute-binding protein [Clostridiales bacterium]|nr:extracellular solute-binding protein [Clostridiales bacterium]